jgi:hypothetical protein
VCGVRPGVGGFEKDGEEAVCGCIHSVLFAFLHA